MIEKILERLEAERVRYNEVVIASNLVGNYEVYIEYNAKTDMCDNAIQIVQEVAKDGGWIPVETELPPMPKENPLFENKPLELYLVTLEGQIYPFRAFWNGKFFTDGWGKVKATAWMELPQPYQKGE